ncbi:precorrin-4 C(11)-methyltransferase [Thermodesulfobacteriota bacterium]
MDLYFIGAGPGDPELITVKASNIIKKADIIIYAGSLVHKDILNIGRKDAAIYDSSSMNLDEVLKVITDEKDTDKIIVRLHTGDLSIYSTIQEQMDFCEENGLNYHLIPGVSSYQAAAAALKQEFTLPGVSQTIILTRISGRTKVPEKESLDKLAKIGATMAIFLSINRIEDVVDQLKESYVADTPVSIVEKASHKDEQIINGTLENIAVKVAKAGIKRQALIIVGDVLRRDYEKSKLYDKHFAHGFRESEA